MMGEFPAPLDPESEAAYAYENPEWTDEDQLRDDMEFVDREAHAVDALMRGESEEEVERKWPSNRL